MKRSILLPLILLAFSGNSQTPGWSWAQGGGGIDRASNESQNTYQFNSEQILDIKVDAQNNYYFLAYITEAGTQFNGQQITVYNSIPQISGLTDILLISTTCEGELRWTQTIGGGAEDMAYKIELDDDGGLYIGVNITNLSHLGSEYPTPHFSPTDSLAQNTFDPGPQESCKTSAILKYAAADGSLIWRRMPQGDVTLTNNFSSMQQVVRDSDGILHTLIGFRPGIHLNGTLNVTEDPGNNFIYYIVRYDSNGNLLGYTDPHINGWLIDYHTDFRYDENLNRYYITGFRTNGDVFNPAQLKVNNIDITGQAYILALSENGTELWRKEMISTDEMFQDNRIYDLQIDANSDLFIVGKYFLTETSAVNLGSHLMTSPYKGNVIFISKLDVNGNVVWERNPNGYNNENDLFTGSHFALNFVIDNDEVVIPAQGTEEIWGSVSISRPLNFRADPLILRLNKNTGTPVAIHEILGNAGYDDGLSAIAVDKTGSYIVGGYFFSELFNSPTDNVNTLTQVQVGSGYSDFFVAKYSNGTPCGALSLEKPDIHAVTLFPNPANGELSIVANGNLSSFVVTDLSGKTVLSGKLSGSNETLSVSDLNSGTYIIYFTAEDGIKMVSKFIKH